MLWVVVVMLFFAAVANTSPDDRFQDFIYLFL